ncbi:MAG: hypothetical protein O7E49_13325 [Gemmatimonadetes bacterium]|nr:hypothetical protein [Gemmatimonadota bacterium]
MTIVIDITQSHGMGMRRYVYLKPRGGANLEAAPSYSEQQGHIVGVMVCHSEVIEPILIEIRQREATRVFASRHRADDIETPVSTTMQADDPVAPNNKEVDVIVTVQEGGQYGIRSYSDCYVDTLE